MRLLCLANSIRERGRCVAGIDLATSRWVRPIHADGSPFTDRETSVGGRLLQLLEVVDVAVNESASPGRFQRENHHLRAQAPASNRFDALVDRIHSLLNPPLLFRAVGRYTAEQCLPFCDASEPLLHSTTDWVPTSHFERRDVSAWKSLQLIRCTDVAFDPNPRNPRRWQVTFTFGRSRDRYCLKLTDPVCQSWLDQRRSIARDCLLTISLTRPWQPADRSLPESCYKVVAAVIEMGDDGSHRAG